MFVNFVIGKMLFIAADIKVLLYCVLLVKFTHAETVWEYRRPTCSEDGATPYNYCIIRDVDLTHESNFEYYYGLFYGRDISKVTFERTKIHFLPNNIFTKFSGLEIFECPKCEITEISGKYFEGAQNLYSLDLQENNITSLDKNVFIGAPKLEIIDLSGNQIKSLNFNTFNLMTNVIKLYLQNNKIETIPVGLFEPLESLEILNLSRNRIKGAIGSKMFASNLNLLAVHLNNNEFENIAFDALVNSRNLTIVNLSSNKLVEFSLDIESSTSIETVDVSQNSLRHTCNINFTVQSIDVSYNEITELILKAPSTVVGLRVQSNRLKHLDFISEMLNLTYLDVSQNALIAPFNSSILIPLTNLNYLFLENVNLTEISYETFQHQTQLKTLDVSYNSLRVIDLNEFSTKQELQQLFIDGNNLTHIDDLADLKMFCPSLEILGVSNNLFTCTHLREIVKLCSSLDIKINTDSVNLFPNLSNFRGISCVGKTESFTSANGLPLSKHHLPSHTNIHLQSTHHAELDEIRGVRNTTKLDKEDAAEHDFKIIQKKSQDLQTIMDDVRTLKLVVVYAMIILFIIITVKILLIFYKMFMNKKSFKMHSPIIAMDEHFENSLCIL